MRKYWARITLAALLIFVAGYGLVSAGRKVKDSIITSKDITIPLGPFVSFKLDGTKVGSIREIKIRRSAPKQITAFDIRVRVSDSAAFERLQSCKLSVNDASNIDDRTTFVCLAADSGYQQFGEVTVFLTDSHNDRTLLIPLLLPESAIRDIQNQHANNLGASLGDSIAAEVAGRIRVQPRAYRDSLEADRLDRRSEQYKARADSIRARAIVPPANPPGTVPPVNPKPL